MTTAAPTAPTWVAEGGSARHVAVDLLRHGPLSRSALARRTGLSQASLTRLTKPLLARDLLVEVGPPAREEQGLGRPARPLDVRLDRVHVGGVNLTGDRAYGVVADLRGEVVATGRAELADRSPTAAAAVVADLVAEVGSTVPALTAVGVSLGGHSPDGAHVRYAPFLGWADVPFAALVAERTGVHTVVANDVVALTAAEHWFGEGRDLSAFALITIGSGVGYGLVVHDRPVVHPDAGLGLAGHHPLDPAGPLCPAGHRGCAAAMLTVPGLTAQASVARGRPVGYDELLDLAAAGDPAAQRIVTDGGRALGRLVAAVANLAMPERVIVTGEGVALARAAGRAVDAAIRADRDPRAAPVDLVVSPGDRTRWARGAAVAAVQDFVGR